MDRKASRGRKKETCGLAKNSDLNGRKKELAVAEVPASRQAVDVCGGIKVASKACLNGSPHLDIGRGEGLNGSVVGASEGPHEGPRQSKTGVEIHQSEEINHHGNAMTHRNTGTAEDDGVGYLEELTPEQQRILWEKRELEQLLEQTKLLQEKAATCFHRTDEKSMESEKQSLAGKQSELASKEPLSARKELNKQTATVVPPEQKAPLSAQAEPDGLLNCKDAESFVSSEPEDPFSLRGNVHPLEENAELLYHKKVELEVLLQTAKVLLEQTGLPELNDNGKEDFSFVDDTCAASFRSSDDSGNKLEDGTTNAEDDDDDDEESEDRSIVETLYERADEITRKAKLFVDMLHEDEDLGPKETQSDVENPKMALQICESNKTDDPPAECRVQKENLKEEDKASEAENKGSEEDGEVQETDEEVDDVETPEQRQELQRLLQQVRQLLATLNGPPTESSSNDDESLKEVEELSRTTEKKAVEGEMVSSLDQKEHERSLKPLEVRAAENELPSGAKKEVYLEGSEIDKHVQDPGVMELQPESMTNSATDGIQPGASEALEKTDKNSWSEAETALLCEKNELSLLLMKTQLLQQKAEMIMSETHIPTAKSDLTEDSSEPSSKAAQLSPRETTETMQTAEITSGITKPDLETTDELSKKLKQTSDTAEPSSEITKQILNTTHLSSGETGKPSVESIAEKTEPHLGETQLSSDTTKEVLEATPASSKTTQETTEVSSEKIKPMLDVTKIGSQPTNPNININEKSFGLNPQASDKISLPSEAEVTSQKTSVENLNTMAENSFKIGAIPQEKKSVEENLQTTECSKYIDDIEHESKDLNLSALRIEATSRTDDVQPTESLSNNEAAKEDTQSPHDHEDTQSPHDHEDSDSGDEDDQSFDAKEELKLLLQRARLIIEKSKIPVSERKPSLHSEMCHPAESAQEQESTNDEPHVSEAAAGKPELTVEENEGSYPKKQILNSETTNKTVACIQQTDGAVEDKTTLSQDAQLELLLAQTTLLKLKADELLNKFNVVSDLKSDQQLPNSELSNENDVQFKQKGDGIHHQINILEAALDQQSANAQLPNEENKVASDLESCAALPSAQSEEESKDVAEQPKRPAELNLDLRTVAPGIDSLTEVLEKAIQSSALPLNEESQLELEEIEESQLEISENEKSQFEIEDEYLSDNNSQLSDMNMYYEDAEYSQDEEEHLPEETGAVSNEECLPQAQQHTEAPVKKETYNEKRELELLLEITQLLLEKATLPLELIETISDENNSHAVTQSVSETVETIGQADQAGDELNLSLDDTMPALETKQMSSKTTETVQESTIISLEKTGNIAETTEAPSQKTETGTETTKMSLNKTENILETKEAPSKKTETVTDTTAPSFEKTETIDKQWDYLQRHPNQ